MVLIQSVVCMDKLIITTGSGVYHNTHFPDTEPFNLDKHKYLHLVGVVCLVVKFCDDEPSHLLAE